MCLRRGLRPCVIIDRLGNKDFLDKMMFGLGYKKSNFSYF